LSNLVQKLRFTSSFLTSIFYGGAKRHL